MYYLAVPEDLVLTILSVGYRATKRKSVPVSPDKEEAIKAFQRQRHHAGRSPTLLAVISLPKGAAVLKKMDSTHLSISHLPATCLRAESLAAIKHQVTNHAVNWDHRTKCTKHQSCMEAEAVATSFVGAAKSKEMRQAMSRLTIQSGQDNIEEIERALVKADALNVAHYRIEVARKRFGFLKEFYAKVSLAEKTRDAAEIELACAEIEWIDERLASVVSQTRMRAMAIHQAKVLGVKKILSDLAVPDHCVSSAKLDAACAEAQHINDEASRISTIREDIGLDAKAFGVDAAVVAELQDRAWKVKLCRDKLATAERSENATKLKRACAEARFYGVDKNRISAAQRVLKKFQARAWLLSLEQSWKQARINVLERACVEARAVGIRSPFVLQLEERVDQYHTALANLELAETAQDLEDLQSALNEAAAVGVEPSRLRSAHNSLALLRLRSALKSSDVREMHHACLEAEKLGVEADSVAKVRGRINAIECAVINLKAAAHKGIVEDMDQCCKDAEAVGVSAHIIQEVQRKAADVRSAVALFNEDLNRINAARKEGKAFQCQITRACRVARERGVPDGLLTATSRRSRIWKSVSRSCSRNPSDAVVQELEAELLVGSTLRRNDLAKLLSTILTNNDSCNAILRLRERLRTPSSMFNLQHSKMYALMASSQQDMRGGHPYYKPRGWYRYALNVPNMDTCEGWCIAYHGTMSQRTLSILLRGLRKPGEPDVSIAHGQAYSDTKSSIYVSPSIEYASHPVYSQFFKFGEDHWGQAVLQCKVRPGSFVQRPNSLGKRHWPQHVAFDTNFCTMDGLEWLLEDPNDVVVYGLLVRELGARADAAAFGTLACQVRDAGDGPQFEWTRLRAAELESRGFLV